MGRRTRTIRAGVAGALLLGVLVVAFAPIHVTRAYHLSGKVFARAEWTLERSGQGILIAHLRDRELGVSREYLVQSIERGDVATFDIHENVRLGAELAEGDTIGVLTSTLHDQRFAELTGLVSVATSEEETFSDGAKEALVREAEARLEGLDTLLNLQQRIVERLGQLRDQGVVSTDELERAQAEALATAVEVQTAEAQVGVLTSGARSSELRLAASRLAAERGRLEALGRQRDAFAVTLPIAGTVTQGDGDSTLIRILDTRSWMVVVPIVLGTGPVPSEGTEVSMEDHGLSARVVHVDHTVRQVGEIPVVIVSCLIDADAPLLEGEAVVVRVSTDPVLLRTRVASVLSSLFRWETWWGNAPRA